MQLSINAKHKQREASKQDAAKGFCWDLSLCSGFAHVVVSCLCCRHDTNQTGIVASAVMVMAFVKTAANA